MDDSHLDILTDIFLVGNTGWFDTAGQVHMAGELHAVVDWFRERTGKNGTRLYVVIGGPGASDRSSIEAQFESQAANHKLFGP